MVACMDMEGNVTLTEIEIIDDQYNEQMKIHKRDPGYNYMDVFGGEKLDDIGQR